MRVIYKSEGFTPYIPSNPHLERTRKESVLVISYEEKDKSTNKQKNSLNDIGYVLTISKEALARDAEVRKHEESHMASLGPAAASGIIYDTVKGPGGETIAVGGKIKVDLSEVPGDPSATLSKARTIISAALGPDKPSVGDMATAAKAYRLAREAQEQLKQQNKGLEILV